MKIAKLKLSTLLIVAASQLLSTVDAVARDSWEQRPQGVPNCFDTMHRVIEVRSGGSVIVNVPGHR
jgi:hypothetical protein